ncbi:MAG: hypothetical protein ACJAWL_000503 [Motiliproteus sp.]|jgi:hypothetical protein
MTKSWQSDDSSVSSAETIHAKDGHTKYAQAGVGTDLNEMLKGITEVSTTLKNNGNA